MSDQKVRIGIETTADTSGAEKAEAALDDVVDKAQELEQAVDRVDGDELDKIPTKAKNAAAGIKNVKTESEKLGKKGDAGRAVLEFSRAFEDAQYGIRGVLNNIPGLVLALGGGGGVAGVISVLAVAGSVLWEKFGQGAKDAADPAIDYLDVIKKIANEFGNPDLDIEKARGENADRNLSKQKRYEEGLSRIAKSELDLEKKKIKGESDVALAQARLGLVRQEAELATASGESAARLTKDREATLKRIVALELQALELTRQAEERAAAAKVTGAGNNLTAATESAANLRARAAEKTADLNAASGALADATLERLKTLNTLIDLKSEAEKNRDSATSPNDFLEFTKQVSDLARQIDQAINNPSQQEAIATVNRDDATATAKEANDNYKQAAEAQEEAAVKLKQAAQDLDNLRKRLNS